MSNARVAWASLQTSTVLAGGPDIQDFWSGGGSSHIVLFQYEATSGRLFSVLFQYALSQNKARGAAEVGAINSSNKTGEG